MSQFPIDKTDDWEARQDAKRQMTPIPPIPEDLQDMYHFARAWRHEFGSERRYGAGTVEVLIERIAKLSAALSAMTADRDLWQEAHNEDCPNAATVKTLEAENTRLKEELNKWFPEPTTRTPQADKEEK